MENNVHSIDVLNWFVGSRPLSAIGAGGSTLPKRGEMRDHNFVAYEYAKGVQGQLSGTTLASPGYRHVVEQFFGDKGMVETSENHWRHFSSPQQDVTEKSPRNITIDAVAEFVSRIAEGRPENTGAQGAESTLTAILGRMAMDARREVTWDEMMKSCSGARPGCGVPQAPHASSGAEARRRISISASPSDIEDLLMRRRVVSFEIERFDSCEGKSSPTGPLRSGRW